MAKINIQKVQDEIGEDDFSVIPPEPDYIAERYVLKLPVDDRHFASRWDLRLHAEKLLERQLGDKVQLTSLKVKKPSLANRGVSKALKRTPEARLFITIKF